MEEVSVSNAFVSSILQTHASHGSLFVQLNCRIADATISSSGKISANCIILRIVRLHLQKQLHGTAYNLQRRDRDK
jgi:hypothetical protein